MLWHNTIPAGICVFAAPSAALTLRSQYFGLKGRRSDVSLRALNNQLWLLARVVLHPTYRGAGVASAFVRRACEMCPVSFVETLSAMGHLNPFFERAGFVRIGVVVRSESGNANGRFGGRSRSAKPARTASGMAPVYYVFDNRGR